MIHTEIDLLAEMVYGVVMLPLAVTVKELRYRGLTEEQITDVVSRAVLKGYTQYNSEVAQAEAGH